MITSEVCFIEDIRNSLFLRHAYIIDMGTLKTLQYPHNINNLTTITSSIYVYTSQIALDICREHVRKEQLPGIDTTPPIFTFDTGNGLSHLLYR